MNPERRPAVIIINTVPGDVRAARGVVSRAIRKALAGYKRQGQEPYNVFYISKEQMRQELPPEEKRFAEPRYYLMVTDDEMAAVNQALVEASRAEGFDQPPVDIYHD